MNASPTGKSEFGLSLAEVRDAVRLLGTGYREQLFEFGNKYVVRTRYQGDLLVLLQALHSVGLAEQRQIATEVFILLEKIEKEYNPEVTEAFHDRLSKAQWAAQEQYALGRQVAFQCSGVVKRFEGIFTLGPVDFEITRGEITGVVGENGNGKTTFFRIVAGELLQNEGSLAYPFLKQSGSKIDWHKVKSSIAYVPQELPRWHGSLRENLEYEAAVHDVRGKENQRSVDYIIERLRLADHMRKSWQMLSGGYKFRFALARALVWKPCLMILDEPLANLDPNAQLVVLRDLQDLARSVSHPIAILLSSQHIEEVEAISDRMVYLREGRVAFNDVTANIGINRTVNTFLLDVGGLSLPQLRAFYPEDMDLSISWDGLQYVLTTELHVGEKQVLAPLLEREVRVSSFRDISRSTKRMFQQIS